MTGQPSYNWQKNTRAHAEGCLEQIWVWSIPAVLRRSNKLRAERLQHALLDEKYEEKWGNKPLKSMFCFTLNGAKEITQVSPAKHS